jgi:hypothetical protein
VCITKTKKLTSQEDPIQWRKYVRVLKMLKRSTQILYRGKKMNNSVYKKKPRKAMGSEMAHFGHRFQLNLLTRTLSTNSTYCRQCHTGDQP